MRPRIGFLDHVLGALLGAAYVAVLLGTSGDLAMSRDESFYVTAAQDYAGWMRQLWNDPDAALSWDYAASKITQLHAEVQPEAESGVEL